MISEEKYCRDVCGASCCHLTLPEEGTVKCPQLKNDRSCNVYEKRFAPDMPVLVKVGSYKSRSLANLNGTPAERPFFCSRIKSLIAAGGMAPEVMERCCVANPMLLMRNYEIPDQP